MANDFSKGKVSVNIIHQAIPLILAQLVQLLYNVVDRVYIGHLPGIGNLALTGIGLAFPVTTLIMAFTNLFGMGGTPLFSMARGAKDEEKAKRILGNTFLLLFASSFLLFAICYLFRRPILFLFGASDVSYQYADDYLKIYLFGTTFTMLASGLNGFINAQGFPKVGMMTIVFGAVLNLILDPVFIFVFQMGVSGAAIATVISQMFSALWVMKFLTGKKALIAIRKKYVKIWKKLTGEIISLGMSGFIMSATNCLVQVLCNSTLQSFGGDLYVGIFTIINSVREILSLPVSGISNGGQPVLGYDFGAKEYGRVKQGIRFIAICGIGYTVFAWLIVFLFPKQILSVFTSSSDMIVSGVGALHLYFFGFCFMAFQFVGQSVFVALGYARRAIFFSLFRKVIIVTPLTILLPRMGLGVTGVFLAEPISNAIGGLASFITMYLTVYRKLPQKEEKILFYK